MKITIITPVFNGEDTIEKTIKSVIGQNYAELEYIIVDGGSTDGTLAVVEQYKGHITHVISEKDKGIADAYNKGIKLATGELIGIIAADDQLTMNALNNLVEIYDGKSDAVAGSVIRHNGERYRIDKSDKNLELLRTYTSIRHPATFVRKDAYEKYGLYSLAYKCAIDRELLLRFYVNGAHYQIVDIPMVVFNVGGISTDNPLKYVYPEDRDISILYGKRKLAADMFYWKSVIRFRMITFLKWFLAFMPCGVDRIVKNSNPGRYLSDTELKELLFNEEDKFVVFNKSKENNEE